MCASASNLCANNVQNHTDPVKNMSLYHFIKHTHTNNSVNSHAQNMTALRPQFILTGIDNNNNNILNCKWAVARWQWL